jgi:hypothetical protein
LLLRATAASRHVMVKNRLHNSFPSVRLISDSSFQREICHGANISRPCAMIGRDAGCVTESHNQFASGFST